MCRVKVDVGYKRRIYHICVERNISNLMLGSIPYTYHKSYNCFLDLVEILWKWVYIIM